jgi:hypothetical protein
MLGVLREISDEWVAGTASPLRRSSARKLAA